MKLKTLVAVVALAATGSANAAITPTTGSGGGDLFLSVINPGAVEAEDQSFHLNLDIIVSTFDGSAEQSWDLVALTGGLYSQFAGETDLRFSVAGANGDNASFGPLYGNYVTAQVAPTTVNALDEVQSFTTLVESQAGALNAAASQGDYAIVNRGETGFYTGPGGLSWGDTVFGVNMSANVGDSLGFYLITPTSLTSTQVTAFDGLWTLNNAGVLSYSAVSAVPVPAAAWLFGSGLLGLVGVARRRKVQA